jgi:hypothetical protein
MITKKSSTYNYKFESAKFFESIDINVGNTVPNWLYRKILNIVSKTDTIALLSCSRFLYHSTGQEEHQKDYDYFCNKFNLNNYQHSFKFYIKKDCWLMEIGI